MDGLHAAGARVWPTGPGPTCGGGTCLPRVPSGSLAYDALADEAMLFGGDGQSHFLGDTWLYDLKSRTSRAVDRPRRKGLCLRLLQPEVTLAGATPPASAGQDRALVYHPKLDPVPLVIGDDQGQAAVYGTRWRGRGDERP